MSHDITAQFNFATVVNLCRDFAIFVVIFIVATGQKHIIVWLNILYSDWICPRPQLFTTNRINSMLIIYNRTIYYEHHRLRCKYIWLQNERKLLQTDKQ